MKTKLLFSFFLLIISLSSIAQTQTTICRHVNLSIPNNSIIRDTINFNLSGTNGVCDLNVIIDTLTHTWDADLVSVIRHLTKVDTIIKNAGGSGDNFINTILNDSGLITINQGTPPFRGTFRQTPPDSLKKFNGLNANGPWIGEFFGGAGDTGNLRAWCIQLVTQQNGCLTGIKLINENPLNFSLHQNYPNPFNPSTKIIFELPKGQFVKLSVFDVTGRETELLIFTNLKAGVYEVEWNASKYSSGIYYYEINAGEFKDKKKMVLIK